MKTIFTAALLMVLAVPAFAADSAKASKDTDAIRNSIGEFFGLWNKNDVKGMITHWADDASLINPMGKAANGKAEIEKLLTEEQTTVFKGSTAKLVSLTAKSITSNIDWIDAEMTVDNAHGPDGAAMPQMKNHIAGLMQKKGGKWLISAARPYSFMTPPPAKKN